MTYNQVPDILVLPEGLRVVMSRWFYNSNVQDVTVSQSVEEIQDEAFAHSANLRKITFAENSKLRKIGMEAFAETQLSEFDAPQLLESIGFGAFRGTALDVFFAPKNLKTIEASAF